MEEGLAVQMDSITYIVFSISIYQNVSVRACESAIAHVRAVTTVRKRCDTPCKLCVRSACVWGCFWSAIAGAIALEIFSLL